MKRKRPAFFRRRHFEDAIIILCVRWYLRYSLSYRDLEEIMEERGLLVHHVTIWRWVLRYAPILNQRMRREVRHLMRMLSGLEVAVNYARSVRGGQTVDDLYGDVEELARRIYRSDRRAFDELHDDIVRADVVQLADVGMIQCGDCAGLALKAFRKSFFRKLYCDGSIETRVSGLVDFAHTTGADGVQNFIRAAACSWSRGHFWSRTILLQSE